MRHPVQPGQHGIADVWRQSGLSDISIAVRLVRAP
jgi:hypothetical protein